MKKDLESRRRAIIRALRGREHIAPAPEPAPRPEPPASAAPPADVDALSSSVSDLAARVEELSRDLAVLRSTEPIRHHIPETPPAPDDDEPVTRASVPPVTPARISDHAFDVLLGRR